MIQPKNSPNNFSSAIDRKELEAFRQMADDGSNDLLIELIECYLEETPKMLRVIRTAAINLDHTLLNRTAHSLRSSSGSLGAFQLSQLCHELEFMTHSDNTTAVSEAAVFLTICQLETEYERVKSALQEEVQGEHR